MGRILHILSIIGLLILAIGTQIMPADAMFWLASGRPSYQIVRAILILLLLLLVLSSPPRRIQFRCAAGITAVIIGVWTIQATYTLTMSALDTFAFLTGSIALLVSALECQFTYGSPQNFPIQKSGVKYLLINPT